MGLRRHSALRVLHLPVNIRWIMDATIKGEEEIGVETRRMLISRSGLDEERDDRIDSVPYFSGTKKSSLLYVRYLCSVVAFFAHYTRLLIWADIVHWQYSDRLWFRWGFLKNLDFALLKLFNKPAIVQFHGGDFRNSSQWIRSNPWWSEAYESDFLVKLDEKAKITQDDFAEADFCFALDNGMYPFVEKENLDRTIILGRGITLDEVPRRRKISQKKVKIVHAPSHPTTKGTKYVLSAVESLQKKFDIEFLLLENMDHDTVLEQLSKADIVIDQLLCGDYGLLAVEAMNAGATVVANVNEALRAQYPSTLPIVQADPDSIREVLEELIRDPEKRARVGAQGPAYAQAVHGYRAVLPNVLKAYRLAAVRKNDTVTVRKIDAYLKIAEERARNL